MDVGGRGGQMLPSVWEWEAAGEGPPVKPEAAVSVRLWAGDQRPPAWTVLYVWNSIRLRKSEGRARGVDAMGRAIWELYVQWCVIYAVMAPEDYDGAESSCHLVPALRGAQTRWWQWCEQACCPASHHTSKTQPGVVFCSRSSNSDEADAGGLPKIESSLG